MNLLLAVCLVTGVVVLTPLADRLRVPQPILLLIFGLVLALLPGLPDFQVEAEFVLPVVLPPLLFAATQRATARQFRDAAGPILLLAVGLTVATAVVVAIVAHLAGLPWSAAAVLGAIVCPPDPVAATAVARRLRLPERVVTVLEGEGMFNDATALVMYKVALAVVLTGEFSAADAILDLVLALVVGVGLGLALGWLTKQALSVLHDATAETTVTIAVPFVAYLGAEALGGSGVLAVLALGLFLRQTGHAALTARGWLLGRSVWGFADFLITSLVFALLGFEVTTVIEHNSIDASTILLALLITAAVVVFRPMWLFPASAIARGLARRRQQMVPYGWRETAVVSWAGMRGVVTVATALALPGVSEDGDELWWRPAVVLCGLCCVLITLVAQGLTLTPVVRFLGVGTETDEQGEILSLRRRALRKTLEQLRTEPDADDLAPKTVIASYQGRLEAEEALVAALGKQSDASEGQEGEHDTDQLAELDAQLRRAFQRASDIERELVLEERTAGRVSPAAADEVMLDIEARAARSGP